MELWREIWPYVAALLPTIGLCFLFYEVMKHIVEGDRRERAAQAEWEREHHRVESGDRTLSSEVKGGATDKNGDVSAPVDFHGDHY